MPLWRLAVLMAASALSVTSVHGQAGARREAPPQTGGCRGHLMAWKTEVPGGRRLAYPVVTKVEAGAPAARAGLAVGDTIVAVGGIDVMTGTPLELRMAVGDTVQLRVHRAGRAQDLALVLGRRLPSGACQSVDSIVAFGR